MANYAHIENNRVTGVYDLVPENWRNISNFYVLYASEPDLVYEMGWRTIQKAEITGYYDPANQYLADPTYAIVGDTVVESRDVIDITPAPAPAQITYTEQELLAIKWDRHNDGMMRLRNKRDQLLRDTDFTQLPDVIARNGEELTQAFVTYRDQLRDLPSIYVDDVDFFDEETVVYPTYPEA